MKTKTVYVILMLFFTLLLAACGATDTDSAIATGVAQTQQISALETAAAGGAAAPAVDAVPDTADSNEDEAPTETPTSTLTPTPGIPMVSVSQDTNCRTGPASAYGYQATISPDQLLEVVGVWAAGDDYVIVEYSGEATCWLWTRYADNSDFSAYELPIFSTPPTPTATYTPTPSFEWGGNWQVLWGGTGPMPTTFNKAGNTISFKISVLVNIDLVGTIGNGGQNLAGTWVSDFPGNGTFQLQIKSGNPNQFVGSTNLGTAICGAKNGASLPSPCQWP